MNVSCLRWTSKALPTCNANLSVLSLTQRHLWNSAISFTSANFAFRKYSDRSLLCNSNSRQNCGTCHLLRKRTLLPCSYRNDLTREFSLVAVATSVATSTPVQLAQKILECIHDTSGFAWWSTILATALMLRLALFPLVIYQNYIVARYENLMPEIKSLAEELKKETSMAVKLFKWDEKTAKLMFHKSLRKHTTELVVRDNCHPFKSTLVVLFQLPAWISFSFALRNMSQHMPYLRTELHMTFFEMSVGGILWFPNLTLPDESFIMPILLGVTNLLITEIHTLRRFQKETKLQRVVTNFFRFMSIAMIPIAMTMPSCITLYWLQSSIFGLAQNLFLRVPKFRRFFRIPQTPSESQTPFHDITQHFKLKLKIN